MEQRKTFQRKHNKFTFFIVETQLHISTVQNIEIEILSNKQHRRVSFKVICISRQIDMLLKIYIFMTRLGFLLYFSINLSII